MPPPLSLLLDRLDRLSVTLVADVLDEMGYSENVLSHDLRPLFPYIKVAGPAFTARMEWVTKFKGKDVDAWSSPVIRMFDTVRPGNIIILAAGGRVDAACWGELMGDAARAAGVVAMVTDGAIRDVQMMLSMVPPFQVYARAFNARDGVGRNMLVEQQVPVECGRVTIHPGDIIMGDMDGLVAIPFKLTEDAIRRGEEKARKEEALRNAIKGGMKLSIAYPKYRVF